MNRTQHRPSIDPRIHSYIINTIRKLNENFENCVEQILFDCYNCSVSQKSELVTSAAVTAITAAVAEVWTAVHHIRKIKISTGINRPLSCNRCIPLNGNWFSFHLLVD